MLCISETIVIILPSRPSITVLDRFGSQPSIRSHRQPVVRSSGSDLSLSSASRRILKKRKQTVQISGPCFVQVWSSCSCMQCIATSWAAHKESTEKVIRMTISATVLTLSLAEPTHPTSADIKETLGYKQIVPIRRDFHLIVRKVGIPFSVKDSERYVWTET